MRKEVRYYRDFEKMPPVLTAEDVALILHMTEQGVRRYARNGTIPAVKVGKNWRFTKQTIQKIVEGEAV